MKLFLIPLLLGACAFATADLEAHGGVYKGPGDTVPPGGGGLSTPPSRPGDPGKPVTPGNPPKPGTPPTPGKPPTPPGPPPRPQPDRGPPTEQAGLPLEDFAGWEYWWGFNRDRFLNLRARLNDAGTTTGTGGVLAGLLGGDATPSLLNEPVVRDRILPALHAAARDSSDPDLLTGAMIAIARIGRDAGRDAPPLFGSHLGDGSQEVAETAAICFGVLKDPAALHDPIRSLVFDRPEGRALAGDREVPARSRAFAAFGAGLIGAYGYEPVKADAAAILLELLETDRSAVADLRVAAVLGLGLLEPRDGELAARLAARLGGLLAEGRDDALVQAHLPITIAKLLRHSPAGAPAREKALDQALRLAEPRGDAQAYVRQSAVIALGLLAREGDPRSAEILAALEAARDKGRDDQTRHYTAISVAYLSAADPAFDSAEAGQPATRFLLDGLRKSSAAYEAWCGLALGVAAFLRDERGLPTPPAVYAALLEKFEKAKQPSQLGALAIGLGLAKHGGAAAAITAKMDRVEDPSFLGHAAIGLGLLRDRTHQARLIEQLRSQRRNPDLLRETAIALGLLGDPSVSRELHEMLQPADGSQPSLAVLAAAASAIGYVGDARSVEPLLDLLGDGSRPPLARAFAAVALGLLADKEWLPWNAALGADLNYRAAVATLTEKSSGNGVLDLR